MRKKQNTDPETHTEYTKELRRVYGEIDRTTSTMWSSTDTHHLHWGRQTRGSVRTEHKEDSKQWQQDCNAQVGYGEIRPVSRLALDTLFRVLYRICCPFFKELAI